MKCFLSGYANDSTLAALVPSPAERIAVTEPVNRDPNRVSVWCDQWVKRLLLYPGHAQFIPS